MKRAFLKFSFVIFAAAFIAGVSANFAFASPNPPAGGVGGLAADQAVSSDPAQLILQDQDRFQYLGWWGQINAANVPVMAEPNSQSKQLGKFSKVNRVKVLEEVQGEAADGNSLWYKIDGGMYPGAYVFSGNVTPVEQPKPQANPKIPKNVKPGEYWIDVNLTKQTLTLFLYDKPVFATYVSTGRVGNATIRGTYKIHFKLLKTRMRGGPPFVARRYDLKNVPYTMYYYGSYGIHGTYWHDKFGTRQSAGCTNLTQGDAKFLFELVGPRLDPSLILTHSTAQNPGTVVYNHY